MHSWQESKNYTLIHWDIYCCSVLQKNIKTSTVTNPDLINALYKIVKVWGVPMGSIQEQGLIKHEH